MLKQTQRIERLHCLIKRQATGTPKDCARRIGISERQLYNTLDLMKELGAPIIYNFEISTYYYEYDVEWRIGFNRNLSPEKPESVKIFYENSK